MVHQRNLAHEYVSFETDYVLETDGLQECCPSHDVHPVLRASPIRKWKLIGCDVVYDFITENEFTPLNFVVHPED